MDRKIQEIWEKTGGGYLYPEPVVDVMFLRRKYVQLAVQ